MSSFGHWSKPPKFWKCVFSKDKYVSAMNSSIVAGKYCINYLDENYNPKRFHATAINMKFGFVFAYSIFADKTIKLKKVNRVRYTWEPCFRNVERALLCTDIINDLFLTLKPILHYFHEYNSIIRYLKNHRVFLPIKWGNIKYIYHLYNNLSYHNHMAIPF